MGGGGGDDGYQARQAQIEADKAQARSKLNYLFGAGADVGPAPSPAQFTVADVETNAGGTDQAAYQKALDAYNAKVAAGEAANPNKAARETLYQGVRDNAFSAGRRRLDEGQTDANRKLKFELFAKGLNGGSEDVNQNALMGRTYNQGLIDLGAKADSAKADFRANDEDTRLSLLQSIDNGMDQGSALSSAMQRMQIASDKAAADANGTSVGDLFDNGAMLYNQSQYAKGRQAGQQDWWNTYSSGKKSAGAATGVTTRLPGEQ